MLYAKMICEKVYECGCVKGDREPKKTSPSQPDKQKAN